MPKTPTPRVPTFPPKDCTEPSPSIVNASESSEPFPPAEITVTDPMAEAAPVISRHVITSNMGLQIVGEPTFEAWSEIVAVYTHIDDRSSWWLGDAIVYGEEHFGEKYAQVVDVGDKKHQTILNIVSVCQRVQQSRRRDCMSFGHHAAIAYMFPQTGDEFLVRAQRERWSVTELRAEVKRYNELNGTTPTRGRRAGSTVAKVAASGKEPQVPEGEKPLIWNGYPLRVLVTMDGLRVVVQGDEPLPPHEADQAAHHHKHPHGPALAAWLEEHNFIKGGDEPCEMTKRSENSVALKEFASNGAAQDATESAPTPLLTTEAIIDAIFPQSCRTCGGELKRGFAIPPALVHMDEGTISEGAWVDSAKLVEVWKCSKCGHSFTGTPTAAPAAPPASPEPPKATETPQSVADEILAIMATYHEQEARGDIDTPGGLEHMGDVWRLLLKWESALRTNEVSAESSRGAATATQTPLQRAEEAILRFNEASKAVDWPEVGRNAARRAKWLGSNAGPGILNRCDEVIDALQNNPPVARK